MKKLYYFLFYSLLIISLTACSKIDNRSTSDKEHTLEEKASLDAKEAQSLKNSHPDCFGLDVAEGLNVLVFENRSGEFAIRLASGSIVNWTSEEALKATSHKALTVEECKIMLIFYGLPDDKIQLRPYQDPLSSYLMTIDDSLVNRIAGAFDNRYKVGTVFSTK